ncbi:MAG TPA: acyl-CoA thioesterase [Planctomycetes bacterium]|nr:acyl-CoA thioesterase [Planctomycetota bacterium]
MNWLVCHAVSGEAFFTGVGLIVMGAFAAATSMRVGRRIAAWASLVGAASVAVSSTPIPYWYYAMATAVTVGWVVAVYAGKWQRGAAAAVVAAWLIAVLMEAPYHVRPTLQPAPSRCLTVIGDSVTAGMGADDESEKWPAILAREHDLAIQDLSHMGETAASARCRLEDQQITSPVVIIEIGGNDLLGRTWSRQFARDLDALLQQVCSPERQVVMFELPLPPFHHEYGRIQRWAARKHGVLLIPKRVFLSVLAPGAATVDTIHLSQEGHRRMAACVWRIVKDAFPEKGTQPRQGGTSSPPVAVGRRRVLRLSLLDNLVGQRSKA